MEQCKHIRGMNKIQLFRLRQWILQYIQRLFQAFWSLQVPYSQKNFLLPSVQQYPEKTDNPASSAEMQQSPFRWNNAPAARTAAWKGTVSGKGEVPFRFSCKHAWLGFALLCFTLLLPSHSLADCAGCENCHCTSWSRFKFHMGSKMLVMTMWIILPLCCSITITIPSLTWLHLTNKALHCSCNQEAWVLAAETICLLPGWHLLPHCFLWVVWSFSSELFTISVRWLWPSWVAPFQQGDVVLWATNIAVRSLTGGCSLAAAETDGCNWFVVALKFQWCARSGQMLAVKTFYLYWIDSHLYLSKPFRKVWTSVLSAEVCSRRSEFPKHTYVIDLKLTDLCLQHLLKLSLS